MSKLTSEDFSCVIVESPFSGGSDIAWRYLRAAMSDCIKRGEAPFASHGLYTQPGVLDDTVAEERDLGIAAGFAWHRKADYVVVYTDLGVSSGMEAGLKSARELGLEVVERSLPGFDGSTLPSDQEHRGESERRFGEQDDQ